MQDITVPGTASTPEISADWAAGRLVMRGDSYPENSFEFFQPVIDWVERYLAEADRPLNVDLFLLYLNTSSIRALMDILDLLEEAHRAGKPVKLSWCYDRENERMAELAEEFKEDCTFPFHIVTSANS
jgi:hypothetical protein